jgi:hypothetical protein
VKTIRFLFAIYVLFLAVYPCSDKETCADERKAGVAVVDVAAHDHSSNEQDFCTPFCICSCCAAHIRLNHVSDISVATLVHNTKIATLYFEKPLLNKAKSIWQPPKIS